MIGPHGTAVTLVQYQANRKYDVLDRDRLGFNMAGALHFLSGKCAQPYGLALDLITGGWRWV
jgi:hypothetical protein